ncbi:MAG: 3-phosphoshikimate 1-carboxyvinyltransferase, partial [Methanocellales archaeon]|nr:3-phosphoshikimate 1-carboxyvinyltransferase [Methanocellales archaeon]
MDVDIQPSTVKGTVYAPPSKSYTHRAVAIASLGKESEVLYPLLSKDTLATVHACEAFGATIRIIEGKENVLRISGVMGNPVTPENVIDVANSGTTLRFMIAIGGLIADATVLTGDASLRKRPNIPLLNAMNELGAVAFSTKGDGTAPIVVKGKLNGGKTTVDGSISSQFISSLLLACPFAEKDTTIRVDGELKSRPYVEITVDMLKNAGVELFTDSTQFMIPCMQSIDIESYMIPGDFSSASYLLAAGAVTNSKVSVRNLIPSKQGDIEIVQILKEMGANISWDKSKGVVTVDGADLRGIEVDAIDTPDLVPVVAVLGACAEGVTRIVNAEHLRYKETDRLVAMSTEL